MLGLEPEGKGPSDMTDTNVNRTIYEQLDAVLKAQETRVAIYREFEDAFKDYLEGNCPHEQYLSICRIVTEGFQEVSLNIRSVEKTLTEDPQYTSFGTMVRRLQEAEKLKLTETVMLQKYTIESRESSKDYDTAINECEEKLKRSAENIRDILEEIRQEKADSSSF